MSFCSKKDWFVQWFDSPYYHLLYNNRDTHEAEMFLGNLLQIIRIEKNAEILDLACGKGRHSITLRSKGYHVTGIDLSPESIAEAKQHEDGGLRFEVADMRNFNLNRKFDCIMNLFTSFGYFDDISENQNVIQKVRDHLQPSGTFVLDYFNAACVRKHLPFQSELDRKGVHFSIHKFAEADFVVKEITVTDGPYQALFTERVQLLSKAVICEMLERVGLKVTFIFGNYHLMPFDESVSERLIIIAQN
jgi:SAM-dependent methyltransferase